MDLSNVTSVFPMSYVHGAVTGGQIRRTADLDGRQAAPKGCEPGTASIKHGEIRDSLEIGPFKEKAKKNSNQVFFHSVPLYFSHFPPPERSVLNHSSPRAGVGMDASRSSSEPVPRRMVLRGASPWPR